MKKIQYLLSGMLLAVMSVSCSQDMDMDSNQGYLTLKINSLVSTHDPNGTRTAVPEGYDAKTLHVEILNTEGTVVKSTDNFASDTEFQGNIELLAGTYTIIAHSANWDGNGSGFGTPYYYGSSTVTVVPKSLVKGSVTCTQANVKLTVNYDQSFINGFKSAKTTISSVLDGISPLEFIMNKTTKSGYIPAGNFTAKLDVVNKNDAAYTLSRDFTDVQPRDHYILNFKVADEGYLGDGTGSGIEVEVDESTNTYTFTFEVPRKASISLVTRAANAWSNFAMLNADITAKTDAFKNESVVMQWRKAGVSDWTDIANSELTIDEKDHVTTTLKGLTPETTYECRLRYVDGETEIVSEPVNFTTEKQIPLYNGGFENWWMDGKVAYANEQGVSYWDTSNKGAASFGGSNTSQETSIVHGGSSAAKLESKYIVIKFAAASLYTGSFGDLIDTSGAWLNWGIEHASRPTALKGYMQYAPANIASSGNQGFSSSAPAEAPGRGEPDVCGMYCALLSESLVVDNTDMSTFPDWETDPRVIAYGSLKDEQNVNTNGQWQEVNIPLVYRDLTRKPTHLLVVFSASKYGDYFHGGKGSLLYVDDFELVYGDNPEVK